MDFVELFSEEDLELIVPLVTTLRATDNYLWQYPDLFFEPDCVTPLTYSLNSD